jgi:hypothetical protein
MTGIAYEMAVRGTRREENQELFRLGNERLTRAITDKLDSSERIPFLCECADEFCNGRVELRLDEWRGVAGEANHYVVVPGHPMSAGEKVVGSVNGYDVVRKPD